MRIIYKRLIMLSNGDHLPLIMLGPVDHPFTNSIWSKLKMFNKKEYHPKWSLIRRMILLRRALNRCEFCDAPNGEFIYRIEKNKPYWAPMPEGLETEAMDLDGTKFTRILLTIAHKDHNKDNNIFTNLVALCQRCHLKHDIRQHIMSRKYGRKWKKNQFSFTFTI